MGVGVEAPSLDGGRASFFHGPGESPDSNGEGSGVTSPMAVMVGLGTVELAADAVPRAVAREPVFKLGVRDTGLSDDAEVLCCREGRSAARL